MTRNANAHDEAIDLSAVGCPRVSPRALVVLAAILLAACILRLALCVGCIGSDDVAGWQVATAMSHGHIVPAELFQNPVAAMRYGLAIPASLLFRLFGNSESVLMVYPIGMSLLGILAVWDMARRFSGSIIAAHGAGLLLAMTSLDIHYATTFLPDGPMAALGLVSIWCAVVGYDLDRRRPRSSSLLFLTCGLLAAFSLMHKIAAVQLVAALGLWGTLLLVRRRFRPRIWWILVGFVAGVAAEHLLFLVAYGDPLHRWKTIIAASAENVARRSEVATHGVAISEKVLGWLGRLGRELPSFSMIAVTSLVAAGMLWRHLRENRFSLILLYFACVLGMRLPELTQTFSYQPRRLLPLAGCTAVLLACLLARWAARRRRDRWLAIVVGAAILVTQAGLLAAFDARQTLDASAKLSAERWAFQWIRTHAAEVRQKGLYVDHRTYKILSAFSGFDDLKSRGVHLFASSEPDSYATYGQRDAAYRDGAYFLENVRLLEWLLPYSYDESWFEVYAELPRAWTLEGLAPAPADGSPNAALFRIRHDGSTPVGETATPTVRPRLLDAFSTSPSTSTRSARGRMFGGWYVWGADESLVVRQRTAPEGVADGLSLEFKRGRGPQLSSGGTITKPPPSQLMCREGEYIMVRMPIQVDRAALAKTWATCKFRVLGYDKTGQRVDLYRNRGLGRLYFARQELRAYIRLPQDIYGIRIYLKLVDPGNYELDNPRLELYQTLQYGADN